VYNAADEKKVNKVRETLKNDRRQELEDIKTLLNTGAGRRFFTRFFEDGRIFTTTFTGNSQTFFLEGHRNLALKYFNDICEASPERLTELMIRKENKEDEE